MNEIKFIIFKCLTINTKQALYSRLTSVRELVLSQRKSKAFLLSVRYPTVHDCGGQGVNIQPKDPLNPYQKYKAQTSVNHSSTAEKKEEIFEHKNYVRDS